MTRENARKSRIAALQRELEVLEQDQNSEAEAIQYDVEAFAKSECLAIASQVVTKLPRELRDMIYHHLSTRSSERIEREHFRTTIDPLTKLYSYSHARWKASHFPEHFWHTEYVGASFFQELVENYYRTSTFIFSDDPSVVKQFLGMDEFNLGILPKDLVSNVEMHLNAVSYDRGSFRAYMFGTPKKPERLQAQLEPIFELRQGARICVHFLTEAKEEKDREEHLMAGLETLFTSVQRAKLAGYKVRFVMDKSHVFDLEADLASEWAAIHSGTDER